MSSKKVWICCSECGSRNVSRDALARWSEEAQCWEVEVGQVVYR